MRSQEGGADIEHGPEDTGGDALRGQPGHACKRRAVGAASRHRELSAVLCPAERGPRWAAGGGSRGRRRMYTRG